MGIVFIHLGTEKIKENSENLGEIWLVADSLDLGGLKITYNSQASAVTLMGIMCALNFGASRR